MSRTAFVSYGDGIDDGFWAYDVTLGVLLKHMIDSAESGNYTRTPWLTELTTSLRISACLGGDFGLTLDPNWSDQERRIFIDLVRDANAVLELRRSIPAAEMLAWRVFNDEGIFPRGADEVQTGPIIELGLAIIDLASGVLPKAPPGTWWFYDESGRDVLMKRR